MKIRSYKGTSREKLYDAIRQELGPDAVIVSARQTSEMKGFMPRRMHEVIAVVDDASADQQLMNRISGAGANPELTNRQEERWKALESHIESLRLELRETTRSALIPTSIAIDGTPAFAQHWDPRFLRSVRMQLPELFGENADSVARERLGDFFKVCERFPTRRERKPHIVVLIGPTGSGKTTTLAKLAASWRLDQGLNVGIVTTDTYRIAAVDQAREYAALLGIEMRIAFSASEARRATESFSNKDIVLVDTPGRNHCDRIGMESLRGTLDSMGQVTSLLLLPATLSRRYAPEVIGSFKKLRPDYLVITKTDEARDLALVTTVTCEAPWPIAFLTDGQRVPQDMHPARTGDIVAKLLGGERSNEATEPVLPLQRESPPVHIAGERPERKGVLPSGYVRNATFECAA